jgi:hypothetical protein
MVRHCNIDVQLLPNRVAPSCQINHTQPKRVERFPDLGIEPAGVTQVNCSYVGLSLSGYVSVACHAQNRLGEKSTVVKWAALLEAAVFPIPSSRLSVDDVCTIFLEIPLLLVAVDNLRYVF